MGRALNLSQFQHNVTDGTTTVGTGFVVNGSAKTWVNFNGTGTVAIRDSLNVASITDNGTGIYTANYTSNMDSVGYAFTANRERNGQYGGVMDYDQRYVGSVRIISYQENDSSFDTPAIHVSIHGDLA